MFEDLDKATAESAEPAKPTWWIGPWAHVLTIPVWFILYIAGANTPWGPYVSVGGAWTVLVFCVALGNSFRDSDDLFGNSETLGYVVKLVIPHLAGLALLMVGVYEWLHLKPELPTWMTAEGRKGSLWYWCGMIPLAGGGYCEGFWMARKIRRRIARSDDSDKS